MGVIEATGPGGARFALHDDGTWTPIPERAGDAGNDFRKSSWGDSIARVRECESGQPSNETDATLTYPVQIAGLPAVAHYVFVTDRLVRAKYIITQEHSSPELFLHDFARLDDLLTEKYGGAHTRNDYWIDDLYQDDPSDWGMAVSVGHLARFHQWNRPDVTIVLALTGDNYDVSLQLEYGSTALADLEEQHTRAAALDDL